MGRSRKNGATQFVVQTYRLVEDTSIDYIISWGTCPNSFIVWSPDEFTEKLLPRFFNHKSFSSFFRQLSYYGFRKIRSDAYEFTHENFVRSEPHRLSLIVRKSKKADTSAQAPGPSNSAATVGTPVLDEQKFTLDKHTYSMELEEIREQQEACARMIKNLSERVQRMEELEQRLMSLVAKIWPSPELLAQLLPQDQQNNCPLQLENITVFDQTKMDFWSFNLDAETTTSTEDVFSDLVSDPDYLAMLETFIDNIK